MDLKEIKKRIENFEFNNNFMKSMNGAWADANNIEVDEDEKMITADVTLTFDSGERIEKYSDCEYSFECLKIGE